MQLFKFYLQKIEKSINIDYMEYNFIDDIIEKKTILKSESNINPFFLENNVNQIEQIIEFFRSKTPLLLVSGFIGTGKNTVVKEALNYLSGNSIVISYNCFETNMLFAYVLLIKS